MLTQKDLKELFMTYNTSTEEYYGPIQSTDLKLKNTIWVWRRNVKDVLPLTLTDLENLCRVSYDREQVGGRDKNNIIIVSMNRGILDFTDSTPLAQWRWHDY